MRWTSARVSAMGRRSETIRNGCVAARERGWCRGGSARRGARTRGRRGKTASNQCEGQRGECYHNRQSFEPRRASVCQSPPRCRHTSSPDSRIHVRVFQRLLRQRLSDRPGNRQHPHLRPRQGHRAERAVGRRDPPGRRSQRQEGDPGGRPRGEADARPHAGQHHRHPSDEGRRHRRLHGDRADAEAVHQEGARLAPVLAVPAHHHLRALRLHAGRAARHPRIGARRRRVEGVPRSRSRWRPRSARTCRSPTRPARWSSTSAAAPPRSA